MSSLMVIGQTSVSLYYWAIQPSTNTRITTPIVYNTTGLTLAYTRERAAPVTAVTGGGTAPVTLASASAAWTAWGFVHCGGGLYRADFPDAAFATTGSPKFVICDVYGVTDCMFIPVSQTDLSGTDPRLTTPPNVNVSTISANAITAASIASDADTEIQAACAAAITAAALATASALATLQSTATAIAGYVDTEVADIQSRLPAALVSGRMDVSVGAMATDVISANAIAAAAVTKIRDGILNWTVFTGYNLARMFRVLFTLMRGTKAGGGTNSEVYTSPADSVTVTMTSANDSSDRVSMADTASGTP